MMPARKPWLIGGEPSGAGSPGSARPLALEVSVRLDTCGLPLRWNSGEGERERQFSGSVPPQRPEEGEEGWCA